MIEQKYPKPDDLFQWSKTTFNHLRRSSLKRLKLKHVIIIMVSLTLPGVILQSTLASAPASNAATVYGQPDLHSNTPNNGLLGELNSTSLYNPQDIAISSSGLYVADKNNNRVLYYSTSSTSASLVYGQADFTHNSVNRGVAPSAITLNAPTGVALDNSGNLYVADSGNNRILEFSSGSTTATRVYGQGAACNNFSSTGSASGVNGLNDPFGVTTDNRNDLYVSDTANNRVLYFPPSNCTASRVYGQGSSGNLFNITAPGSSATSLNLPFATTIDASGDLYVADNSNNRVVYFQAGSFTVSRVYGQADLNGHTAGVGATNLHGPAGLLLDNTGGLYVSDSSNNRIVYYQPGTISASRVYGQPNQLSNSVNYGGLGAASLQAPFGIAQDSSGTIFVGDGTNNRVLTFEQVTEYTDSLASAVFGQPDFNSTTINYPGGTPNPYNLHFPAQLVFDSSNGFYVADQANNRVLYFPLGSSHATKVYGQGTSGTDFTSNGPGTDTSHFRGPFGVALDSANGLYVADQDNNRVLYFPAGSFVATKVYGQVNYTSSGSGASQTTLNAPDGIALDHAGGLYVTENVNNRVVYYPPTLAPAVNIAATRVYGQGSSGTDFTSHSHNSGPTGLGAPIGVAVDKDNGVYIGDQDNVRILYYPAGSVVPTRVYGQPDFNSHSPGASATQLGSAFSITLDSEGGIYVTDPGNSRVVYFPAGTTTATRVYGQPNFTSYNVTDYGGTVSASNLNSPFFAALDSDQNLYVSDYDNNRVVRYDYVEDCSPSTVTSNLDNGTICTLRGALENAHSGDSIKINFLAATTIHLTKPLETLQPNVTIQGLCDTNGPEITLDGTGVTGIGVQLSGGDYLYGLKIRGFNGPQLMASSSSTFGPNTLTCVTVSRT